MIDKIPEIINAKDDYRNLKRELNKKRHDLRSLFKEYKFIMDIVDPNCQSDDLELAIVKLFNNAGFTAKKQVEKRDLDVYVNYKRTLIGIEVKGETSLGENEIFQVFKYAQRFKSANKEKALHPILIWNNSKYKNNFSPEMAKDAILNNYGILTTTELQKGFVKLKSGKIKKQTFLTIILQEGLVKFTNKNIDNIESGAGLEETHSV